MTTVLPPEHNPAVLAARFMRALVAEDGAVTRVDVAARTAPVAACRPVQVAVRRPSPVSWRAAANCAGVDPELFYPERGGSKALQAAQIRSAKAVCEGCSVRAQCLIDALERQELFGIWGGMSERERRRLQRRLPRVARCGRCGGRYTKTAPGQKFCGRGCPALAHPRARRRAS